MLVAQQIAAEFCLELFFERELRHGKIFHVDAFHAEFYHFGLLDALDGDLRSRSVNSFHCDGIRRENLVFNADFIKAHVGFGATVERVRKHIADFELVTSVHRIGFEFLDAVFYKGFERSAYIHGASADEGNAEGVSSDGHFHRNLRHIVTRVDTSCRCAKQECTQTNMLKEMFLFHDRYCFYLKIYKNRNLDRLNLQK